MVDVRRGGAAMVARARAAEWNQVEFGEGEAVKITTKSGALLLVGHSVPLDVTHGPSVMSTMGYQPGDAGLPSRKFGNPTRHGAQLVTLL
jgi:hypothetical protein